MTNKKKEAALLGKLQTLVAKNSWGTNRLDRGLTNGYTRFDRDYLFKQWSWKQSEDDNAPLSWYTTLTDFVLPPGY